MTQENPVHLFKKTASTRNFTIVSSLLLVAPLFYFLIEKNIEKAAPVLSAFYGPILTGLTLYLIYRQLRLTATIRVDQDLHDARLIKLDFAKYWSEKLAANFSSQEKIESFFIKLSSFSKKDSSNKDRSTAFQSLLISDKDFILTHQLYLILLQLKKEKSRADAQARLQVEAMAFSILHPNIFVEFEMAMVQNGGSEFMKVNDCVFLTDENF